MTQVTKTFVGTNGTDVVANDSTLSYGGDLAATPALSILATNVAGPRNDNGAIQFVYLNSVAFGQRQSCKVTMQGAPGAFAWTPILRHDGTANNWVQWYVSSGYQSITVNLGGVATNYSAMDKFVSISSGDVAEMEISADSTQLSLKVNGSHLSGSPFTINPANYPSGTRIGAGFIGNDTTESGRISQFVADDFAATTPAALSGPGSTSVSGTTASGTVTSDLAGGTMYAVLTPTNVAPTAAEIKAGTGGGIVAASSGAAVSGVNTHPFTGLSTTTQYYLWFVQNNGVDSNIPASATFTTTAPAPTVSSVSTSTPANGASLTITGTGFNATQAGGSVTIGGTVCSIVSWSDTSIVATIARGLNKYGVALDVVVTNGVTGVPSAPYAGITGLIPQAGWSYVDLTTPNSTASLRVTAAPDVASGDQIAYDNKSGQVVVVADATFSAEEGVTSFDFEVWTPTDGWGSAATQTMTAVSALTPIHGLIWF